MSLADVRTTADIKFHKILVNYTEIKGGIFEDAGIKGDLKVPRKVTLIGHYAFEFNRIRNLEIGNSVTHIHYAAFANNPLKSVSLGRSLKYIGHSAFEDGSLKKLDIPSSVNHIGEEAFMGNKIKNLFIPDCVQYIGPNAFSENPMTRVSLPSHFKKNDDIRFAFDARTEITFRDKPQIGAQDFPCDQRAMILGYDRRTYKAKKETYYLKDYYKRRGKMVGSNGDDILHGGLTNDKIKGGRGADTYILSAGKDKFLGFKISEGDVVHINSVIDYEITSTPENKTQIVHELGVTTVKGITADDLQSVIQIV